MRLLLGLCLLALTACTDAQDSAAPGASSPEPSASEPIVVADGRETDASTSDDVRAEWGGTPAIQAAMQAAQSHWATQDPALEPDLRVLAVAEGAFTEAGASEHAVLYLVTAWPRCCPKVGLAVVRDDQLVHNATFESTTYDARRIPDLDGDGMDDLALWSSFGMGGQVEGSVSVVSLAGEAPSGWGSAPVMSSGCGAMQETETAMRLTATPITTAQPLSVSSESFTRPCAGGEWSPSGTTEALELPAQPADAFVALPVE